MDNTLLKDTIQLLHESADLDVYYFYLNDNVIYRLIKTDLVKVDYSFQSFLDLFHPADRSLFKENFDSVVSGLNRFTNKVYRKKQNASDKDYQFCSIYTIRHECENKEVDYVMYSIKNITDIVRKNRKQVVTLDKFKTIFYNLPFATVCFDSNGRVIEANSNSVTMYSEWFGIDIYNTNFLYTPGIDDNMRKCFYSNQPFSQDIQLDIKNHQYKEVKANYVPVSDDEDKFVGHMMLLENITQEKAMERENNIFTKKIKMVTEHFGLMYMDCYPDTRTFSLEGGHGLAHMEHVPIQKAYDLIHPDDLHLLQEFVEASCNSAPRSYEIELRMHLVNYTEYRNVSLSLIPSCDESGKLICYTGLMVDVTDRVRQLKEKEETLRELRKAMEKAEESDRLKSSFLANVSHEIRTPLNAIIGFSELLATGEYMDSKDEFYDIIHTNTDRLLQLVNGILSLSKLESGSIQIKETEFEINEFIRNIYDSYKGNFYSKKNIEFLFVSGEPCKVLSDENKIKEVLINLLNNAINYTHEGNITLKSSFDGKNVRIEICDTGTGIRPEDTEKVFNRFEKLGSFVPGSGLGLTICKTIMSILNGNIGVESKYGEGSTFWISLPAEAISE